MTTYELLASIRRKYFMHRRSGHTLIVYKSCAFMMHRYEIYMWSNNNVIEILPDYDDTKTHDIVRSFHDNFDDCQIYVDHNIDTKKIFELLRNNKK